MKTTYSTFFVFSRIFHRSVTKTRRFRNQKNKVEHCKSRTRNSPDDIVWQVTPPPPVFSGASDSANIIST